MKTTNKIMASAIALAVGLSTASAADITNNWFAVDFESVPPYALNGAIAGVTQSPNDGSWTKTEVDASKTVTLSGESLTTAESPSVPAGNIGKIDGQGGSLIWTPTNAVGGKAVLLDADVYMVGSEEEPTTSATDAQTEVYLKNDGTSSYLCANVASAWVQLENVNVTITDKTWIKLRIEINYDTTPNSVSFYVNGYKMTDGTSDSFDVMEGDGALATKVTSVSFMGTGYLDNFVGKTVVAGAPTYGAGVVNTDGDDGEGVATSIVDNGGTVTATFATGTKYITLSGDGYSRTVRTTNGVAAFDSSTLPAGTYSITAFYGDAPTLTTGVIPAAVTVGVNKAAAVESGNISFTVAPKSGVYYTLFAGATPASLTAGAASVLALPSDQDAGFLKLAMPVPTNSNEVKIIKIYASDENFAKDATAPQ